jgi:hypothetical protein
MGVVSGGKVIAGQATNPGLKNRIYKAEAVPTDANIGYDGTPPNGTLAENVVTGFVYERQVGVWVRVDTL